MRSAQAGDPEVSTSRTRGSAGPTEHRSNTIDRKFWALASARGRARRARRPARRRRSLAWPMPAGDHRGGPRPQRHPQRSGFRPGGIVGMGSSRMVPTRARGRSREDRSPTPVAGWRVAPTVGGLSPNEPPAWTSRHVVPRGSVAQWVSGPLPRARAAHPRCRVQRRFSCLRYPALLIRPQGSLCVGLGSLRNC